VTGVAGTGRPPVRSVAGVPGSPSQARGRERRVTVVRRRADFAGAALIRDVTGSRQEVGSARHPPPAAHPGKGNAR
jgi:hypothetical protein